MCPNWYRYTYIITYVADNWHIGITDAHKWRHFHVAVLNFWGGTQGMGKTEELQCCVGGNEDSLSPRDSEDGKDRGTTVWCGGQWESQGLPQSSGLRAWERQRDCSVVWESQGLPQSSGLRGWERLRDCSVVWGTMRIPGTPSALGTQGKGKTEGLQCGVGDENSRDSRGPCDSKDRGTAVWCRGQW